MFCSNCGNKLVEGASFCGECGNKIEASSDSIESTTFKTATINSQNSYTNEEIEKMGYTIRKNIRELNENDDYLKPSDFKWAVVVVFIGIAIIIYGNIRNGSTFLATKYIRIVNDYSLIIGAGWFFLILGIIGFIVILYIGIRGQNSSNYLREENNRLLSIIQSQSNNGNMQARCELGLFYRYGYLVKEDFEKAFNLFKVASNADIAVAQYQLGIMYENGLYIDKNDVKALNWYTRCNKSLEGTDEFIANAYNKIGEFYRDGKAGLSVDYDKAFNYFKKAVEYDTVSAKFGFYNLGLAYQKGQGCKKDFDKASYYLDKAYDYGVNNAQNIILENTGGKY